MRGNPRWWRTHSSGWRPIGWTCCSSERWCFLWQEESVESWSWDVVVGEECKLYEWNERQRNSLLVDLLCDVLTSQLHLWKQYFFGKKFLQSCRLVSPWDGVSWGGTGRCLALRLTEPSTTAEPLTGEACSTPVGQTPDPQSVISYSQLYLCLNLIHVCSLFCVAPWRQRGKSAYCTYSKEVYFYIK